MKRCAAMALAVMLVVSGAGQSPGGDDTYYPYQMYEEYYRLYEEGAAPSPGNGEKPAAGAQVRPGVQDPAPGARTPGFLFPEELGFGVAIGVPQDLFYLSGTYYLAQGGGWYRASSHRGPWRKVPRAKLPPELLKHDLATVRSLRNREFRRFWEEKKEYRGRHFRPGQGEPEKRPGQGRQKLR